MHNLKKINILFYYLGIGLGSGLFIAPGTCASIVALFLWYIIVFFVKSKSIKLIIIIISFLLGIYICKYLSNYFNFHDHKSIVWDEFVGMWITFFPFNNLNFKLLILGIFIFRFLDIIKPYPINWIDKNIQNSFGIMIDDVCCGIISYIILYLIIMLF